VTAIILASVIVILTVAATGFGIARAYGSNVEALTQLKDQVKELRATSANILSRVGRLEARDELNSELSGRVRQPIGKGDV